MKKIWALSLFLVVSGGSTWCAKDAESFVKDATKKLKTYVTDELREATPSERSKIIKKMNDQFKLDPGIDKASRGTGKAETFLKFLKNVTRSDGGLLSATDYVIFGVAEDVDNGVEDKKVLDDLKSLFREKLTIFKNGTLPELAKQALNDAQFPDLLTTVEAMNTFLSDFKYKDSWKKMNEKLTQRTEPKKDDTPAVSAPPVATKPVTPPPPSTPPSKTPSSSTTVAQKPAVSAKKSDAQETPSLDEWTQKHHDAFVAWKDKVEATLQRCLDDLNKPDLLVEERKNREEVLATTLQRMETYSTFNTSFKQKQSDQATLKTAEGKLKPETKAAQQAIKKRVAEVKKQRKIK